MKQAKLSFAGRATNPTKASPAQLAARARFAEMARSGAFKKKATKRKVNPSTYDPYAPRDHLAEYRTKTDAQLRYIMKDAGEAAKAMRGHSPRAEEKYLDQINDAATILWERKQKASKRKVNPGTSDATLANWLDKIASGMTFSESKLKEALQHPGITAEDKVTIKAAIKGAPYSHTDLHQAAINIRQMGQRAAKAYSELPPHLQELADKIRAKKNPAKKTVSQKISQLRHEGYPQRQAVAVALSEQRAGKVKRNPSKVKHVIEYKGHKDFTGYAVREPGSTKYIAVFASRKQAVALAQNQADYHNKTMEVAKIQLVRTK